MSRWVTIGVPVLAFLGLLFSAHALWINAHYRRRMRYQPWCDFSEHASCSRAFTSNYSRVFGIHNAWFGILAYPSVAWLAVTGRMLELLGAGTLLVLAAASLAYVSYVRMRNYCAVCTAIYAVNIGIFLIALYAY